MLRILIADDHWIVRHGLSSIIIANGDWHLCGEAADGETAYAMALQTQPDVIVLDISMPGLDGVSLCGMLHQALPRTALLAFTIIEDAGTVKAALNAGVTGYVLKSDGDAQLAAAISSAACGRSYHSPSIQLLLNDIGETGAPSLSMPSFTPRELLVTDLIAHGYTNQIIAKTLDISIKTVESHRGAALRKAKANTAVDLVHYAIRHHLIEAG
jgi:DNA-binding NarL/FixJ family response regulator